MIIWLASYPRSGNTFFRVLLNKVFGIKTYSIYDDKSDIGADEKLSNVVGHKFLPEGFDLEQARSSREVYFIKTHDSPAKSLDDKVVYLMRDGRESTLSFLKYLGDFHGESKPLADMINGHTPFGSWGEHVAAWNPANRANTLLVQFEKLIVDPHNFIDEIAAFTGQKPVSKKIPTFRELHKKEPKFFRSGKTDSWKTEYSESDQYLFWLKNHAQMVEYGYTSDMPESFVKIPGLATLFQLFSSQNEQFVKQNLERLDQIDRRMGQFQAVQVKQLENLSASLETRLISLLESMTGSQVAGQKKHASEPGNVTPFQETGGKIQQSDDEKLQQPAVIANEQGESCFMEGRLEEAEEKFIQAIRQDPGLADGYNNLGVLHWKKNDIGKALEYLATGLRLVPDHRDLIVNTAEILKELGKTDDAVVLYESYLKCHPDDNDLRHLMSEVRKASCQSLMPPEQTATLNAQRDGPATDYLVTAIVSTYNSEKYIQGCLDDLVAQTIFDRLEIIVVDSGSEQNERVIIEEFQKRYPNIRYIRTDVRETVYGAWNRAIAEASGKYLTNSNTDDRHLPGAFERMVLELDANPDVALVYADSAVTSMENSSFDEGGIEAYFHWPDFDARHLFAVCYIGPHPMWRRSLHDKYGYFDAKMTVAGDYDFWLRLVNTEIFKHVPEVLGLYLSSSGSIEHVFSTACVSESETARQRNWPAAWGERPGLCNGYLLPVEDGSQRSHGDKNPQGSLVSIVMPTRNRLHLLGRALDSVIAQSYRNWELILINDGGESVGAVVDGRDVADRIRYKEFDQSRGQAAARNTALEMARGEIICYLDDDDIYLPDHLQTVVKAMRDNSFIYTDAVVVSETLVDNVVQEVGRTAPYTHGEYSHERLLVSNYIPINTWAHKRSCLDEAGVFDRTLTSHEDWEFLLRLAENYTFHHVEKVTVEVRQRIDRIDSVTRKMLGETEQAYRQIYARHQESVTEELHNKRQAILEKFARNVEYSTPVCEGYQQGSQDQDPGVTPESESAEGLYKQWQSRNVLDSHDIALFENRMHSKWSKYPSVHFVLIDVHVDEKPVIDSVSAVLSQLYSGWGLSVISDKQAIIGEFDSEQNLEWISAGCLEKDLEKLVSESSADWMVFLFSGDQLERHYLLSMLDLADVREDVDVVYSDSDIINNAGEYFDVQFKPDADIDRLRSTDYIGNGCLLKTETVRKNIGLVSLAHYSFVYGMLLKIMEDGGESIFAHDTSILFHRYEENARLGNLPASIARRKEYLEQHLERCGLKSFVIEGYKPGVFYVEYQHDATPFVSIIIPTKDKLEILEPCVSSLLEKTRYQNFEVIVVDNNSSKPETLEYFDKIQCDDSRVSVIKYPEPYNYSAINNLAAKQAKGDYLVLLNNDTAVIKEDWLERMLSLGQREDVGIVGARLLYPDATIQHAGVVVGMTGIADHSHIGAETESPGYMGQNLTVRGVSAVTAACLLIKKDLFFSVNGLDEENFAVLFNDVDLCLKVGKQGSRIVYTPYAVLMHHGSFSLKKKVNKPDDAAHRQQECLALVQKWLPILANDPAYNRNLCLYSQDVAPEGRFIPGWDMHRHDCLRLVVFPANDWRDENFAAKPVFSQLQQNNSLRCSYITTHNDVGKRALEPAELERGKPDVLLFHTSMSDSYLKALEYYSVFNKSTFKVLMLDDPQCFPSIKRKKRGKSGEEKAQRIRKALESCDRLLVTNRQLEEAWSSVIDDIKVVPGHVEMQNWDELSSHKRQQHLDAWLVALALPENMSMETGVIADEPVGADAKLPGTVKQNTHAIYQKWIEAHSLQEHDIQRYTRRMMNSWSLQPAIHLLITHVSGQEEALADTLDSLGSQLYSGWGLSVISNSSCLDPVFEEMEMLEWCQVEGDLMRGVNAVAEASGADWLGLLEAGCIFEPHMLYQHIEHLHQHPEWRLVYMDEDRIDHNGERYEPLFKPECDLELLRATPYMGAFVLVERQALLAAGAYGLQAGVESSDAIFRVIDQNGEQAVGHIPDVLIHRQDRFELSLDQELIATNRLASVTAQLNRCGIEGEVKAGALPGSCFVDYACHDKRSVEIIVPVTGKPETLELFLDSLLSKTHYPDFRVRLLVSDTVEIPDAVHNRDNIDIVSARSGAQWQEVLELARNSDSDYLMLMSPGAIAIQPNWLERLVAHFQKPDVAVVAPRLISSDKTVVGGGIITGAGLHSVGVGAFDGLSLEDTGYMGRAQVMQTFSAVPTRCILVRKSVLGAVEDSLAPFRLAFSQSVDFCLRVRETGGKIIWTPHSTLMFIGEPRAELDDVSDLKSLVVRESEAVCSNALTELANDPAYNPNLRLNGEQFSVNDSFTLPIPSQDHALNRIIGFGVGSYGSWQYRVVQPLDALHKDGVAQRILVPFSAHNKVPLPTLAELERIKPDTLLMHNTLHDNYIEAIRHYKKVNDAFIVFGQDDLMSALPPSNPFSKTIYKDIKKRIRTCLSLADRLLVTTEPLAQALRGMVDDIVVVPNYIDEAVWGSLQSQRGVSAKPRVGWAGAQQHLGDLRLLEAVVRETASEVDWIFFGMCPESILSLVKEVHDPVLFEAYPEKLATLNLDLAVAPLERNKFNESKSNLRLLEYGILGWPVIASDVEPYQNAPVCRVTNQARTWINAIRERINDLDAMHREGDSLRHWVRENWMLQNHANAWLDALKPSHKADSRENPDKLAASL